MPTPLAMGNSTAAVEKRDVVAGSCGVRHDQFLIDYRLRMERLADALDRFIGVERCRHGLSIDDDAPHGRRSSVLADLATAAGEVVMDLAGAICDVYDNYPEAESFDQVTHVTSLELPASRGLRLLYCQILGRVDKSWEGCDDWATAEGS